MQVASIEDWVTGSVGTAGYPGLAALIMIESVFPPIPSEIVLPLAGYYVSTGEMAFLFAVVAATLGSLAGALVIYAIARFGGRSILLRHGRFLRIDESDLTQADEWFDRHGSWIVLGGRLIPGVRSLVSIPAGLSEMPLARFALLTTIGSAIWNSALIGAGMALGDNYRDVGKAIGPAGLVLTALFLAFAVGLTVYWLRRRKDSSGSGRRSATHVN